MIRKFKALSLALAAVCAFSAMLAPGASAGVLSGPDSLLEERLTFVGEETGAAGSNALTAFGGKTECPGSTLTGHEPEVTPHKPFTAPAPKITLTPHYKNCTVTDVGGSKFPATVDMNGCDYLMTIGETTGGLDTYGVDIHIICPAEKSIQVTLFSSSSHGLRVCTLTVKTTTPTSDAHLTNTTEAEIPDVDFVGTYTNIEVVKSGLCGGATDKEGVFHIDATLKGFDEAGNQVPMAVLD